MAKRKQPKAIEIIELSSDSEGDDVPQPSPPNPVAEEAPQTAEEEDHPLLRIEGIRYNTEPEEEEPPKPTQTDAPAPAKLPVRAKNTPGKDTGSARHRHVSIEIALPTSSLRATKGKAPATEIPDSEEEKDEVSIYKTPNDRRKHITFDDSDNDEYLTPMEHPGTNALELAPPKATDGVKADLDAVEEEQEDEEDSDDEAPEAVSSHAAGAQQAKSSQAAMNAAKQQAAEQKRKRQERDAFLKRQAGEKKKQKAAKLETEVIPDSEEEQLDDASPPSKSTLFPEKRKREIPKLLPLDLLDSDDDDSDDDQAGAKAAKRQKKLPRNGAAWVAEPKGPRDQQVGSTVYRVVDKRGDGNLAPKAKAQAVNLKMALMNRGRKTARPNKGFFVKKA